ncbi:hypothetical protein CesoFtcFv8_019170 [Champsocephalus esox]|uniref:Uncharacterized protein n=1 Tax=Champsocephalus esox TaxID=159716 RepID=A0AAN8BJ92_9TELE|nr:hypothetical protein CesoFtcFv8_019170 [Champsocephalus esox]
MNDEGRGRGGAQRESRLRGEVRGRGGGKELRGVRPGGSDAGPRHVVGRGEEEPNAATMGTGGSGRAMRSRASGGRSGEN